MPNRKQNKPNDYNGDHTASKINGMDRQIQDENMECEDRRQVDSSLSDGECTLRKQHGNDSVAVVEKLGPVDDQEMSAGCSYWSNDQNRESSDLLPPESAVIITPSPSNAASAMTVTAGPSVGPSTSSANVSDEADLAIEQTESASDTEYGDCVHPIVASHVNRIASTGLSKAQRKALKQKYFPEPPSVSTLLPDVHESLIDCDEGEDNDHVLTTCALSSLNSAMKMLLTPNHDKAELMQVMMDSLSILADKHHSLSVLRRDLILSSVSEELRNKLKNTKIENGLLFGSNLSEVLSSPTSESESADKPPDAQDSSPAESAVNSQSSGLGASEESQQVSMAGHTMKKSGHRSDKTSRKAQKRRRR